MQKQDEIWKDIPEYEGLYQVSNLGNVKSLERKSWNGFSWIKQKKRILKPSDNGKGYLMLILSKNGKTKGFTIHQLVAMAFLNHTPSRYKVVVDHINGDTKDNKLTNLQLLSNRDNILKGYSNKNLSSKYPGVTFNKRAKKFKATIYVKNKINVYLGYFKVEEEAYSFYLKAFELKHKWNGNDSEFRKLITIKLNQK